MVSKTNGRGDPSPTLHSKTPLRCIQSERINSSFVANLYKPIKKIDGFLRETKYGCCGSTFCTALRILRGIQLTALPRLTIVKLRDFGLPPISASLSRKLMDFFVRQRMAAVAVLFVRRNRHSGVFTEKATIFVLIILLRVQTYPFLLRKGGR